MKKLACALILSTQALFASEADLYHAPLGFVNFDWLRLCQIDLPPRPARLGQGLVGQGASLRFGCVSQSQNSQNLTARGIAAAGRGAARPSKHTTVISVTQGQFAAEVERSAIPVVVDCYADWCGPCKRMAPIFAALSLEWQSQVKFVKLDVDAEPALARELKVRSIPTFLFYKGGKIVGSHIGGIDKEAFVEKMNKFLF